MSDIAVAFVAAAESSGVYGGMDDAHFIDALYQSALQRHAEGGEAQWWVGQLASGALNRGDVLLAFANSAEKIALIGNISTSIETL
jgi:hypothetical protein